MAHEIGEWLDRLGLGRYAEAFADNEIDLDALPHITVEDLEKIGVALGARRKLLAAIAELGDSVEPVTSDQRLGEQSAGTKAERRQLTVMFVDLVGSTALSERLDPEDLREVIRAYQETCADAVSRFEGHVAKLMGDGALAYFGYPRAHEDDAERAVRAGLNLVQVISKLHTPDGQSLAARIGIATGLVVVGDLIGEGAAQEEAVVGETPNLAARLQTLAEPGSVVIGGGTRRLLGDLFELSDLGQHSLRGFAEPLPVWRAVRERAAGSRFEAVRGERLTRFVSRGDEVSLLLARWQQAKEGEGQVVLLSGEAGIGKSRITQVLMERVHDEPHVRLRYQCSPHHVNTALHPFAQQLSHAASLSLDDPIEVGLDKLEQLLARGGDDVSRTLPLIAELLSIPTSDRYPPLDLTPPQRKSATFDALLDQLAGLAAVDPVLVLFEDMHWADPTSRELWDLVVARIASLPVLAVITFRPEFDPPWGDYGNVTALSLNRLGRRHSAAMVVNQCDGKNLPAALLDQILDQADGIPLFLEELTTAVLSSDLVEDAGESYALTAPLGSLSIPATLQDSLLARLDRLAPVKEVAQLGATIGRTFGHELLAAVAQLDETALGKALDQLVEAGIVQRRGMSPAPRYAFKHALVRDAAYQSLLKSTRHQYHLRIARALERHFPAIVENEPEVAARLGDQTEAALLGVPVTRLPVRLCQGPNEPVRQLPSVRFAFLA